MNEQAAVAIVAELTLFTCESIRHITRWEWMKRREKNLFATIGQVHKKKTYFLRDTNGGGIAKILCGLHQGNLAMASIATGHLASSSEKNFFRKCMPQL